MGRKMEPFMKQTDWCTANRKRETGLAICLPGEGWMDSRMIFSFSETFFCWTNPLLQKGYKRQLRQVIHGLVIHTIQLLLKVEDVFELPPSLDLHALEEVLLSPDTGAATATQPGFSFAPVLLRVYGRPFALLGVLRLVGDLFKFASAFKCRKANKIMSQKQAQCCFIS